jgi:hypothetical protein
MEMFERCGMKESIGEDKFFWSTDKVLSKLSEVPRDVVGGEF